MHLVHLQPLVRYGARRRVRPPEPPSRVSAVPAGVGAVHGGRGGEVGAGLTGGGGDEGGFVQGGAS